MNPSLASNQKTGPAPASMKFKKPPGAALRKALLFCGLLSSLWYVTINIIVPVQYPGYSTVSQTVSELSAIEAPTRKLWTLLSLPYSLLVLAFAWGVAQAGGGRQPLRTVSVLLFVYGVSDLLWPLASMHQRPVLAAGGGTLTDTLHIAFSIATVLLMVLMMGFAAAAFGKSFRLYSVLTLILLLGFGALTGVDAPKMVANQPTPWMGVWERISIGVFMIWLMVLAARLLRSKKSTAT